MKINGYMLTDEQTDSADILNETKTETGRTNERKRESGESVALCIIRGELERELDRQIASQTAKQTERGRMQSSIERPRDTITVRDPSHSQRRTKVQGNLGGSCSLMIVLQMTMLLMVMRRRWRRRKGRKRIKMIRKRTVRAFITVMTTTMMITIMKTTTTTTRK